MYAKPIDSIGFVAQHDPELAAMMDRELTRQQDGLELIASENFASPAVIAAMGSTGQSTGNHLHFEIRINGALVSARNYFPGM